MTGTERSGRPADEHNIAAALYAVACTGIFAFIFTSGRFTGDLASPLQIMFLRYAGGFLTVLVICLLRGESWASLQSPSRGRQALRALTGSLGGAAIIYGNTQMPVVDVTAISQLSAVFLVLLGIVVLGDRLNRRLTIGIAISIAGAAVLLLSRGAFSQFASGYLLPTSVVVLGSLLLALEGLFIKMLAASDRPLVTLVHVNLMGMLILAVPAMLAWRSTGWINLALLGLGPAAILAQYFNIRANTLARISLIAPLSYTSLVFAALIGMVFFAELPTMGVVVGAAIIVLGGLVISAFHRRRANAAPVLPASPGQRPLPQTSSD